MADEPAPDDKKPEKKPPGFFEKYATLLSSTVLGVAGLAATSIWQCRQSSNADRQAVAQQQVARTQADNSWKIERADVLSKNIDVLAKHSPDTVDQRYGVLLSLTRGNLLDPELAASYALELGKDNADYMQTVLTNVKEKDWSRLARAFTESCEQRYGVSPAVEACTDPLAPRSVGLTELVTDEGETALTGGPAGPMELLKEERPVQSHITRMAALFTGLLDSLYEDRKWDAINKFIGFSNGAHEVAAIVLMSAHTGEFITDEEAKQIQGFTDLHAKWFATYLAGPTCDAECKSRALGAMLSRYAEARGSFGPAAHVVLEAPHASSALAFSFLHTRLLWCQVDPVDAAALRDEVLVPLATKVLSDPKSDTATRDSVLSVVLLIPDPTASDDEKAVAAWGRMIAAIEKTGDKSQTFKVRRDFAESQRANPPAKMKKLNFCAAPSQGSGAEPKD